MKIQAVVMALFLLIGGISAQAQLKFGLKGGVNLAKISLAGPLDNNFATSNLTGFKIGPMIEGILPGSGLGLDAAVLYSQQGFKLPEDKSYELNTLEIPVNFKLKLTLFGILGIYGTAGPYIKLRLSDNLKDQIESQTFGAGLNFGIGSELFSHLQVGVNYQKGLVENYRFRSSETDATRKTITWSVTAAYLF
ncbi:MAG: porin family protein [Dysgonamonadaceae bacterium]|jgi:hypothetical protein|nr:porin family protein [Dysgonamonadaceae bacterium]